MVHHIHLPTLNLHLYKFLHTKMILACDTTFVSRSFALKYKIFRDWIKTDCEAGISILLSHIFLRGRILPTCWTRILNRMIPFVPAQLLRTIDFYSRDLSYSCLIGKLGSCLTLLKIVKSIHYNFCHLFHENSNVRTWKIVAIIFRI